MDRIADTAERDDVRYEIRIEERQCFLAMYRLHLRARGELQPAQSHAPALHHLDGGRLSGRVPVGGD